MNTPYDSDDGAMPRDGARQPADREQQLRQQAESAARQATDAGKAQLDRHRNTAADQIDKLAESARAAADELGEQQSEGLSHYLGEAAGSMHGLADNLRRKNADELIREASRVARQNPGLFIAGSIAIGVGIARFAKASAHHRHDRPRQRDSQAMSSRSDADAADHPGSAATGSYTAGNAGAEAPSGSAMVGDTGYPTDPYPNTTRTRDASGRDLTGGLQS